MTLLYKFKILHCCLLVNFNKNGNDCANLSDFRLANYGRYWDTGISKTRLFLEGKSWHNDFVFLKL